MENLPNDLIYEILLWLPVESLLRFRSVCKSWCQIIDSRDFIYSHLDKSSKDRQNRKLIWKYYGKIYNDECYKYSFHDGTFCSKGFRKDLLHIYSKSTKVRAVDINNLFGVEDFEYNFQLPDMYYRPTYCNGLVLFEVDYQFSVLNPSTKHYRKLPTFPNNYHSRDYNFGFGYDAIADDYKVVLIILLKRSYDVWIFRFRSSCWRRIQGFPYIKYKYIDYEASFVDGCVHFLCREKSGRSNTIVAFEVARETFSIVPWPSYESEVKYDYRGLEVFEGCLSIKIWTKDNVDLFIRKKEGVGFIWSKLFTLTRTQFKSDLQVRRKQYDFKTVGYSKEGDKILLLSHGRIHLYNLIERSLETTNHTVGWSSIVCTESLVSVFPKKKKKNARSKKLKILQTRRKKSHHISDSSF